MPMPSSRLAVVVAMLAALAAGCSKDRDGAPRGAADEPEASEAPTGVRATEGYQAGGSGVVPQEADAASDVPNPRAARAFTCEGGHKVEIGDLVAVVTLADGRTVQIARDADDAFRFRGEALAFRMTDGEGELAQDEGGVFHCRAG